MKTLICMVGLPRSGKSTWCQENGISKGIPVVNPDSVRLALHGHAFIPDAESMVWAVVEYMTKALFLAGHDIVIHDATNTTKARRDRLKNGMWNRVFVTIPTDAYTCRMRVGHNAGLLDVIAKMADQWETISRDEFSDDESVLHDKLADHDLNINSIKMALLAVDDTGLRRLYDLYRKHAGFGASLENFRDLIKQEYEDVCKAGFDATFDEYVNYLTERKGYMQI